MIFENLKENIEMKVTEKRRTDKGNIRHVLVDIIFIALCGCLSGSTTYEELRIFGKAHIDWLKKYLELPNGIPSADTIQRVLEIIDARELSVAIFDRLDFLKSKGEIISIDGKTIRGSSNDEHNAYHVVSAFVAEHCITLGEVKTSEKSNEITAVPKLLKLINVRDAIITADAMSCQKDIVEIVAKQGGDYVVGLKGNQKTTYEQAKKYIEPQLDNLKHFITKDDGHGRVEKREYYLFKELNWLQGKEKWSNLQAIGIVRNTVERDGTTSKEVRYFITSLTDVEQFAYAVRQHWGIENKLHWVLDVVFKEDASLVKAKNAPLIFNELRKTVIYLLKRKKQKKISYQSMMYRAGMDNDFLEDILFG